MLWVVLKYVLWGLGVLSVGLGGFLAGYLKKKGENLATHEDIGKVLEEVRATTQATKEIEAKISSAVWDRQKRWELKREVLFKTADKIATAKTALTALFASYTTEKNAKEKDPAYEADVYRTDKLIRVARKWNEAAEGLDWATLLVDLACGKEVKNSLMNFAFFTRTLAEKIKDGQPEAFRSSLKEYVEKLDAVSAAMRKEIAESQPSEIADGG